MKPYLSILKISFLSLFQYRVAAFSGIVTQLFWGFAKVMILSAFYANSSAEKPISLLQVITFIWLGQAFLQLLPFRINKDLEEQIRSGDIIYELSRPINLYWFLFFKSIAIRVTPTILRAAPIFILAGLFLGLPAPDSFEAFFAFCVSILFGIFLSISISTLMAISVFWTVSATGMQRLFPSLFFLFSGMIVPLPLFPDWFQPFLNLQPLRGILDIPSRIYMGLVQSNEYFYYLGFQLFWSFLIMAIGMFLMKRVLKLFIIQGG